MLAHTHDDCTGEWIEDEIITLAHGEIARFACTGCGRSHLVTDPTVAEAAAQERDLSLMMAAMTERGRWL